MTFKSFIVDIQRILNTPLNVILITKGKIRNVQN